jgi:hypothetical protein
MMVLESRAPTTSGKIRKFQEKSEKVGKRQQLSEKIRKDQKK